MKRISLKSTRAKVIAAAVAVAAVGGTAYGVTSYQASQRPEVALTSVVRNRLTNSVLAVADIEAGDRNVITLSSAVKVTDVLVKEGQRVSRGDVLAVLDTSAYRSQLEQQGISLADAESTLRYLSGSGTAAANASAQDAVGQARIAVDNARAAYNAASQNLAALPATGDNARQQAEITVDGARANLAAAESALSTAEKLGEDGVRQARIAVDAAQDAYHRAERDLALLKQQLDAGLITQAQFDAQCPALRYALDAAGTTLASAKVALGTAETTADSSITVAEQGATAAATALASAETALERVELATDAERRAAEQAVGDAERAVSSAESALANAQTAASHTRQSGTERVSNQRSQVDLLNANVRYLFDKISEGNLRAAVDGVVSRVDAEGGQYPELGDLIVVEGTFGYVASAEVSQADSAGLTPGQRASVVLQDIGTTYQGSVAEVSPVAERSATSADQDPKITVRISILDPDDTLRIGFEADAEIFLDDKDAALQVGAEAVRTEPGTARPYVFVVDDRNRVSKVFIRTGIVTPDHVEVLYGLDEGQDCVANPDASLTDGTTVRIAGGGR